MCAWAATLVSLTPRRIGFDTPEPPAGKGIQSNSCVTQLFRYNGSMVTTSTRTQEIDRLETAVSQMAHLLSRTRRHDEIRLSSGVELDRAAIVVLRTIDEHGPLRPAEVAELLLVDRPHITRQIQVLDHDGLVRVSKDPRDARARVVEITPAGRIAAQQLRDASRDAVARALGDWNPDDLATLGGLLADLVTSFRVDLVDRSQDRSDS